jgi:hypothetical protein
MCEVGNMSGCLSALRQDTVLYKAVILVFQNFIDADFVTAIFGRSCVVSEHSSCHGMRRHIKASCAIKLLSTGTR